MVSNRRLLILVAVAAFLVALVGTRFLQGRAGGEVEAGASLAGAAASVTTVAAAPASLPTATGALAGSAGSAGATTVVVVDVAGAVRRPGIVRLGADPRVADAIRAAGGPTRRADLATVNLAAHVVDGAQIVVGVRGATPPTAASPAGTVVAPPATTAAAGPVSLSTADAAGLETLPGVGPATAQKIIDYRNENGPFQTVDDLLEVAGIGPAKLEALRSAAVP